MRARGWLAGCMRARSMAEKYIFTYQNFSMHDHSNCPLILATAIVLYVISTAGSRRGSIIWMPDKAASKACLTALAWSTYLLVCRLTSDAISLQDGDAAERFWARLGFRYKKGPNPTKARLPACACDCHSDSGAWSLASRHPSPCGRLTG